MILNYYNDSDVGYPDDDFVEATPKIEYQKKKEIELTEEELIEYEEE